MRWFIRSLLALLIALGIVGQTIKMRQFVPPPPVTERVAALAATLGARVTPGVTPQSWLIASPGCDMPLRLEILDLDGRQTSVAQDDDPNNQSRFIYLGDIDAALNLRSMRARWAIAGALFAVGIRQEKPGNEVVWLAIPKVCDPQIARQWLALSPW